MIIAETNRLIIRTWKKKDLKDAFQLWSDPEVTKYIAEKPFNEIQVKEHLERLDKCQNKHGFQYWALELKEENRVLGCCGLRPWIFYKETKGVEMGFHIARPYWKKGLATEAAKKVIHYAFHELELKELYAGHHPDNEASRNLLLKLNFKKFKDLLFPQTGSIHPSYLLKL